MAQHYGCLTVPSAALVRSCRAGTEYCQVREQYGRPGQRCGSSVDGVDGEVR